MPARKKTPPEVVKEIERLAEAGRTTAEIVAETGVSRKTVYRYANGLQSKFKTGHAWTREEIDFVDTHYHIDMTTREIADHLGLRRNQVKAKAEHIGVSKRNKPLQQVSDEKIQKLIMMASAGDHVSDIAKEIGFHESTVRRHIVKRKAIYRLWARREAERRTEVHKRLLAEGRGYVAEMIRRKKGGDHDAVRETTAETQGRPTDTDGCMD